ncbi:MAG TPA: ATP-dependent RNA helicase, partial [Escherichia coli]|nr:ATP-dependent RNA helicase [Escherichia coli]
RMLDMGFSEDVQRLVDECPNRQQTMLFSATTGGSGLREMIGKVLNNPEHLQLNQVSQLNATTRQQIITADHNQHKEQIVNWLLANETYQKAIVFTNTRAAADRIYGRLVAQEYKAFVLHGEKDQKDRKLAIDRLKQGGVKILVATDVAARGLDVERISLVVNYDIPMDSESYVHRIGRTGRAGRAGRALLFVENRERRLLRNIERTMKLTIPEVELPNAELLGKRRLEKFAAKVQQQLESSDLDQYRALLSKIQPTAEGEELDLETLAAALLKMAQGERTLIVPPDAPMRPKREFRDRDDRGPRDRNDRGPRGDREDRPRRERRDVGDMQLYRIEVGRDDGVEVRHIVGAIANEGDISSRYIGNIKLFASHSTIELPKGMPGEVLQHFTRTRILNKPMNMQLLGDAQPHTGGERRGGGRGFSGERREGGRNFSGERREGGRGDGRRFSGERREGRAPRRDDSTGRRRFGGDA